MAKENSNSHSVDVSTRTLIKILVILAILGFLWFIRDIVLLVIVAIILASALDKPVDWLSRRGVPRSVGVIFMYLILIGLLTLTIALIIPPIAEQTRDLASIIPELVQRAGDYLASQGVFLGDEVFLENAERLISTFGQSFGGNGVSSAGSGFLGTLTGFFGGIFQIALVLVLTFYLVVQENGMRKFFRSITPVKHAPYVTGLIIRIQDKIGSWFRAQLLLGVVVGVLIYIGLTLLGVEYALVLAILAGILEIVPYIGPILAAIPAIFLAFSSGPLTALFVLGLFILVQQLENNILVPKIMQRAVGLNPVIVIIVLLIGAKVAGLVGLLLAVPVTVAIAEFGRDFIGPLSDEDDKANKDTWIMRRLEHFRGVLTRESEEEHKEHTSPSEKEKKKK